MDLILDSTIAAPSAPPRFATISELLDTPEPEEIATRPLLSGEIDDLDRSFDLPALRAIAGRTRVWLAEHHLGPGDTVALLRLPDASELPLAALLLGLLACGVRVLLTTGFEIPDLERLLRLARVRRVLIAPCSRPSEQQRRARSALARLCAAIDTPLSAPASELLDGDEAGQAAPGARAPSPSALLFT
ncbi:MAG: hypothetical protein CME06_07430, partial [Gemmatimonadetes bacterium]|nr:hypothetical protein [Gemmatimonadota bacterium]